MNKQQAEIDVLKSQVKTLKRIVYGVVCLLVAGIALNACSESKSIPDVIQAKKFLVVNDEGKAVAGLGSDADGGVLDIFNKDEKRVAALGAGSDGGVLAILNKDGKMVAGLEALPNGGGQLAVANKDGKPVGALSAQPDGGAMAIINNDGKVTFRKP